MNENDKLTDPELPKTLDDAIKVAKSLIYWLEFIKTNPLQVEDAVSSFGGHIDLHLATLDAWFSYEKINSSVREMKNLLRGCGV